VTEVDRTGTEKSGEETDGVGILTGAEEGTGVKGTEEIE